jgi:hypothetical protein
VVGDLSAQRLDAVGGSHERLQIAPPRAPGCTALRGAVVSSV